MVLHSKDLCTSSGDTMMPDDDDDDGFLDKLTHNLKCYSQPRSCIVRRKKKTEPLKGTPPNGPHTWLPQALRTAGH
ncbi:hypothetical protein evm_002668 [Chilo suppressalis]|nr:hypothetical protein evm_002668 [Chilo suppressalis]